MTRVYSKILAIYEYNRSVIILCDCIVIVLISKRYFLYIIILLHCSHLQMKDYLKQIQTIYVEYAANNQKPYGNIFF